MTCQDDQLCAGLKAGIDGAANGFQANWDENLTAQYWVFLPVDTKNLFNKINRVRIL